jgi:hypothetical protein
MFVGMTSLPDLHCIALHCIVLLWRMSETLRVLFSISVLLSRTQGSIGCRSRWRVPFLSQQHRMNELRKVVMVRFCLNSSQCSLVHQHDDWSVIQG